MNPYWLEDDALQGKHDFLTEPEIKFWTGFIDKYLKPIPPDPKREVSKNRGIYYSCIVIIQLILIFSYILPILIIL